MTDESDESDENKWTRRGVLVISGGAFLGGVGTTAALNPTETADWVFTIFGATRTDAPVTIRQVSTFPPGRAVREVELLLEAEEDVTIDVLVEIDGEDEPDDGWPILEGEAFDEGEERVLEVEFDETYGGVQDDELLITVEETGLDEE